ncbi:MAG: NBR1-Ig-like domain-containing protein [Anaerolineales bacterium]
MKALHIKWLIVTFTLILVAVACNLPLSATPTPQDIGLVYTQAAQTVVAQLTLAPSGDSSSGTPPATTAPDQPTATSTLATTNTPPPPTSTQKPAPSATPKPTATPLPCNLASFVKDVTVSDGTTFAPEAAFTKTWRLKNVGSCTWDSGYRVVYYKGEELEGTTTRLPEIVRPGETDLVAPDSAGTYQSYWMLRDSDGRFGIGSDGESPFWVKIRVKEATSGLVYNFATSYCVADWESDAGNLPCPGNTSDKDGFVAYLSNPNLESRHENEATIWTNPEMTNDGWITGSYPGFKIKDGDHFIADVGCLANHPKCDVIFQLNYRTSGPNLEQLGEWHEVYDGKTTRLDVDLSALDGEKVEFVLTVLANGSSKDDAAFWLMPQIYR